MGHEVSVLRDVAMHYKRALESSSLPRGFIHISDVEHDKIYKRQRVAKACRRPHCSKFCNRRSGRPADPHAHADFIPPYSSSSSFFHYRFLGTHASLSRCQVHNGRNAHAFAPHLRSPRNTRMHTLTGLLRILPRSIKRGLRSMRLEKAG